MITRLHTLRFEPDPTGGTATIEGVAESVHALSEAVQGLQEGLVDQSTVETIVEEVMTRRAEADREANARRGFRPEDLGEADQDTFLQARGADRVYEVLSRPAQEVAPLIRRPADDVRVFQRAADQLVIVRALLQAQAPEGVTVDPRELRTFSEAYLPALMAMDSTTAAEGDEYVPTELSPNLIERVNLQLRVAALWPAVAMPTNPWEIPGRGVTRKRLGKGVEATADTGQTKVKKVTPATRKVTLSAVKFWGEALVSKELEEDSIIAILPFIEEELVDYLAADIEDTLINGDAQGAHMDADVTDTDDPRTSWDGLRALTQSTEKVDGSSATKLTPQMLRDVRKKLGKYAASPMGLVNLVSINGYLQLLEDAAVQTLDKYGPAATILTGELGRVDGVPIIVSEFVRTDLDSTGVNNASPSLNTEQIALQVYVRGFIRGIRRGLTVEILRELYSESDQDAVKITTRQAYEPRFPTTESIVGYVYNVDS